VRLPSDVGLRAALGAVALAGACICGYLAAVRLGGGTPACPIGGGCAEVQSSEWAEVAGVPLPFLGLGANLALLVSVLLRGSLGRLVGLPVAVAGVLFSGWLTYVEVAVIDAVCAWCVTSAALMLVALLLVALRARDLLVPAAG